MSSEPPPARSWLRRNRLADLQRAATANERMVFDDLDRIVQAARGDQRVAAQLPRRGAVGDLTTALNLKAADTSIPTLPSTIPPISSVLTQCTNNLAGFTPYAVPVPQSTPTQEPGSAPRPAAVHSTAVANWNIQHSANSGTSSARKAK